MWMLLGNEWAYFKFILSKRINMYPTMYIRKEEEEKINETRNVK